MDYKNIDYKEFVKKLPDFMTLYDIFNKYNLDAFVMSDFPGNMNKIDFNFHEYPYDEIYHTITPTRQKHPCTNELKLRYEYVLNREDFDESVEYVAMVLKGDNEKAEEVKQRILDKVAKRKQGYLEERVDAVVDSLIESGLVTAETSRNEGNGYIGFSVWNGVKWIEQFQNMR